MKNITPEIHAFKEAARHVWNMYYSNLVGGNISDVFSNFEKVEKALFWAIVVAPLNAYGMEDEYRNGPIQRLAIQLKDCYKRAPLRIGLPDSSNNIAWGNTQVINKEEGDTFLFIDFFDWDFYGFIDQPYVRFFIKSCRQEPAIEGKHAIIEMRYMDFFLKQEEL